MLNKILKVFKTLLLKKKYITQDNIEMCDNMVLQFTTELDDILLDQQLTKISKSYRIDKRQGRKPKSYVKKRK